jgi:polyhydroxybutyrate depolymerase
VPTARLNVHRVARALIVGGALAAIACTPGSELRDGGDELDAGSRDRRGSDHGGGWDSAWPHDGAAGRDTATGYDSTVIGTLVPGTSTLQLSVAGSVRDILLIVPDAVLSNQRPLVIALHGNGDSAANFVASVGLDSAARAQGVILAVPQGIAQQFSYAGQNLDVDWDAYRSEAEGNMDLPLLDAIYNNLLATSSVQLGRIYLFGYSQGGYLAFRQAMEDSASLAAAVVVSAANPLPGSSLITDATRKIPIAITIGSNDYAISLARQTRTELENNSFEVRYEEITGAGHTPFPGNSTTLLGWLLEKSLY